MDSLLIGAGIGIGVFSFFAGIALFYWVVSTCDRKEEREGKQ